MAQERIHFVYYQPFGDARVPVNVDMMEQRLQPFIEGDEPHSAAALDYIDVVEKEHRKMWEAMRKGKAGGV